MMPRDELRDFSGRSVSLDMEDFAVVTNAGRRGFRARVQRGLTHLARRHGRHCAAAALALMTLTLLVSALTHSGRRAHEDAAAAVRTSAGGKEETADAMGVSGFSGPQPDEVPFEPADLYPARPGGREGGRESLAAPEEEGSARESEREGEHGPPLSRDDFDPRAHAVPLSTRTATMKSASGTLLEVMEPAFTARTVQQREAEISYTTEDPLVAMVRDDHHAHSRASVGHIVVCI